MSRAGVVCVANPKGVVSALQAVQEPGQPLNFLLVDSYDIMDNPHGYLIDSLEESQNLTKSLYTNIVSSTKIALSETNDGIYYAINDTLQYVFVRNYQE